MRTLQSKLLANNLRTTTSHRAAPHSLCLRRRSRRNSRHGRGYVRLTNDQSPVRPQQHPQTIFFWWWFPPKKVTPKFTRQKETCHRIKKWIETKTCLINFCVLWKQQPNENIAARENIFWTNTLNFCQWEDPAFATPIPTNPRYNGNCLQNNVCPIQCRRILSCSMPKPRPFPPRTMVLETDTNMNPTLLCCVWTSVVTQSWTNQRFDHQAILSCPRPVSFRKLTPKPTPHLTLRTSQMTKHWKIPKNTGWANHETPQTLPIWKAGT